MKTPSFLSLIHISRGAGVVLSCLSSVAALKAVAGGANGVFSCMGKGMAFYDRGTWDIESVLVLEAEAERHGVCYVYMPMGKGPEAAEAGESPLFFGGSKDVYELSLIHIFLLVCPLS